MMFKMFWRTFRKVVAGRGLSRSVRHNQRAADELDALLREVMKR